MLGQIIAFLAVATSVAFASTYGCYSGYGGCYGGSFLGAGVYNGVCGSQIVGTGCAIPPFTATVGAPEVVSSCGNSFVAPVISTGVYGTGCGYGYGSTLGGCGAALITTVC